MVDMLLATAGAASAINPREVVQILPSTGASAPGPDGRRTPTYGPAYNLRAQFQRLAYEDLVLEEQSGLNIQGQRAKIFVNGMIEGVVRATGEGGDLLTRIRVDQSVWKCVEVIERYFGTHGEVRWTSAIVTMQNVAPVAQNN